MKPARIDEKIAAARRLYDRWGGELSADAAIAARLGELSQRVDASRECSLRSGVSRACGLCDREDGGSCCGAGIEEIYGPELLLINLLLGAALPEGKSSAGSCYFLGERGCVLAAREVLCVNYLCAKLKKIIAPEKLLQLQKVNGAEMELLFLLHNRIKNFIRRRGA